MTMSVVSVCCYHLYSGKQSRLGIAVRHRKLSHPQDVVTGFKDHEGKQQGAMREVNGLDVF